MFQRTAAAEHERLTVRGHIEVERVENSVRLAVRLRRTMRPASDVT